MIEPRSRGVLDSRLRGNDKGAFRNAGGLLTQVQATSELL
jgi:hypothetical protein